jgi:hypothetical protein
MLQLKYLINFLTENRQKIAITSKKEHPIVTFMKNATISEFKELIQFFGQQNKDSDVNCLYRV